MKIDFINKMAQFSSAFKKKVSPTNAFAFDCPHFIIARVDCEIYDYIYIYR